MYSTIIICPPPHHASSSPTSPTASIFYRRATKANVLATLNPTTVHPVTITFLFIKFKAISHTRCLSPLIEWKVNGIATANFAATFITAGQAAKPAARDAVASQVSLQPSCTLMHPSDNNCRVNGQLARGSTYHYPYATQTAERPSMRHQIRRTRPRQRSLLYGSARRESRGFAVGRLLGGGKRVSVFAEQRGFGTSRRESFWRS